MRKKKSSNRYVLKSVVIIVIWQKNQNTFCNGCNEYHWHFCKDFSQKRSMQIRVSIQRYRYTFCSVNFNFQVSNFNVYIRRAARQRRAEENISVFFCFDWTDQVWGRLALARISCSDAEIIDWVNHTNNWVLRSSVISLISFPVLWKLKNQTFQNSKYKVSSRAGPSEGLKIRVCQ